MPPKVRPDIPRTRTTVLRESVGSCVMNVTQATGVSGLLDERMTL